ncbi:MAG: alkylmercury lyase family protein [Actinomycetota bacterium]|nr:alkylmercury lyase family protein [Actinomycetota bacterium]
MLLFRSEEHVTRWAGLRQTPPGATFTPQQGWRLANAWFEDRLSPDWRRKTPEESQAVFDSIGLVGEFWQLAEEVSVGRVADTPGA